MAKVLGIGGIFFKAQDRSKLIAWYRDTLDIQIGNDGAMFAQADAPAGAFTVLSIFPATTKYFEPSRREFMINFIVDDVEAVLHKAEGGGAHRAGEIQRESYGTFGWFIDPEGNKIELWQIPAGKPEGAQ
jgi:predicted enzyme related to lactoylglutathione lyase